MRSIHARLDPLALQDIQGVSRRRAARSIAFLRSTATVSSSRCLHGPSQPPFLTLTFPYAWLGPKMSMTAGRKTNTVKMENIHSKSWSYKGSGLQPSFWCVNSAPKSQPHARPESCRSIIKHSRVRKMFFVCPIPPIVRSKLIGQLLRKFTVSRFCRTTSSGNTNKQYKYLDEQ